MDTPPSSVTGQNTHGYPGLSTSSVHSQRHQTANKDRYGRFAKSQTRKNRSSGFRNTYWYPNGQSLSQSVNRNLHFLGRGRHAQISQLWSSVRNPKGQSNEQPRLRPLHSSSPVKTRTACSLRSGTGQNTSTLWLLPCLPILHTCAFLSSTTAFGVGKMYR